ncbi:putative C2 domain, GRAM domain, PH-like domain superfamily, VASt domain, C2 domain superfamily [Helianthus annuus]|uniref:C2 domain, GRAM domain, PH-like domain superfamily, VASt domain, C2 domain superfamily n=1 Tax=Helianthus annuus TaxID=4232 RepID=A0A251VKY3_HELAN|nr:C2 and GRAM domain-containing protein At1g03370 [Helianthus annuus]KAF5820957.1 putative C2 domain, GRAM domain, PH-like domain superfamily, VASt domain, C2 domain superfamily [Helianthus annuus]KAJ0610701.1 putative prolycopenC2 and GRAM domain-containing protein [Helianthus annuus]KAJ0621476.1 putative C2 domain, GRAM domain, PH-like domain superfamily, VASt domain, C2 domain superfamily [Helianthus annuus]KAJ0625947.1 putative prolycopenC2 and GRAM domain-containing protein [Helianthus an
MRLLVRVIEARNMPPMDPNGSADPYVKLKLGHQRFKTKVVKKCLNPSWCEEFSFKVEDLKEQLVVSVFDEDKFFSDDFVGSVKINISSVFDTVDKSLGTVWYPLQPKKKSKIKDCGEILLTICFSQNNPQSDLQPQAENGAMSPSRSSTSSRMSSPLRSEELTAPIKEEKSNKEKLTGLISQIFSRNNELLPQSAGNKNTELPEVPETDESEVSEDKTDEQSSSSSNFEELIKKLEEKDDGGEMPANLPGGIMLDQMYAISPSELNTFLFSPESDYLKQLADVQGSTDLQVGPWKFDNETGSLKRTFTYVKAPSRLIKAIKAIEDQTYLKADGKCFSVLASVNTPEAPYASNYRVEVQTSISPGPELPSGEECSHLVVSWRMNFIHNTMMKGMIEGGARQGVKESFEQVASLLSEKLKVVDVKGIGSEKEQALASLQVEKQSDWKLAVQYFANFTVISTILMGFYVLVHIFLSMPSTIQGLEFGGLDLPDSIGEVVVCGVLVLQGERVMHLISRFMQARVHKGGDHGIKATGDGWQLTVALVEGCNIPTVESNVLSDPYVVFTCNGKTRTSSIKFQKSDPRWNEIFEFDAMDDPPSTLDVEVFDFDGPFDEAVSLGHTQINFVRSNISELGDVWVPLQGQLAQACQAKLHLRIFLNNTRGSNIIKEYLTKMEKEVGKKIKVRSPQTNSAFQKLFKLPPEEFLINDFTCHLKRKMPLQGRLFLSARIIGFHGDLFGHKTNFYFLWEDIEDVQVLQPTLSSMGSPVVVITLHPGRGLDAKHGAKTQDAEGRLKFHFQSFVSFNVAHRTIMALWRARALSPEQKAEIAEEESDDKNQQILEDDDPENRSLQSEESGSFLGLEDVSMSVVYSSVLSVPSNFVMELFSGSELERRAMDRAHCVNYSTSPWEFEKTDVYQRQTYYKFDISVSRYGGEVTSSQQKSRLTDRNGWLVEEVTTLHGVPLGDYFTLHTKYQIEDQGSRSTGCKVVVHFGIAWLKSTKHKKKITKNIHANLQDRMMIMFSTIEKEFVSGKQ